MHTISHAHTDVVPSDGPLTARVLWVGEAKNCISPVSALCFLRSISTSSKK